MVVSHPGSALVDSARHESALSPDARKSLRDLTRYTVWGDCLRAAQRPAETQRGCFFHTTSKSLIVADLLFNIDGNARFATRVAARLGGFYRRLAMPLDMKLWYVRDREAL